MDSTERQFARLTQLVVDGIASDADRAALTRLAAERPELVNSVADELVIDALLKWQSGSVIEGLPFLQEETGLEVETGLEEGVAGCEVAPAKKARRTMPLWAGMVAATLLIGCGLAAWLHSRPAEFDVAIADIINQQGVHWSDSTTALASNDAVGCGRLSSSSGEYTLQFRDGVTVRVSGEASLEIKSNMLLRLDYGQVMANVPDASKGFTVASALVDVVDQGTEFGMSVGSGRTDVVVFDGKVDLMSNLSKADAPKRRLTQGEAVKVDSQGTVDRIVDVRRDVSGRWWSSDHARQEKNVISRVADNIGGSSEIYACYQTTSRGLWDDALAYSDNPHHQWNGLTDEGLPECLRGADYIRTLNDYRYQFDFQMTVEFSQPAYLYVFADNRIPPPSWLAEKFEDTGLDIGLDEGPWLNNVEAKYREFDVNTTAVGAGKSVDNVFSVWRRRCADGKPITLGSAGPLGGEGNQGRAMYGIAATPLDAGNASSSSQHAFAWVDPSCVRHLPGS